MTPKQQRFVEEYLIDLNATQAAIRAGYKFPQNRNGFYVYFLVDVRSGAIFYVGKGKGNRLMQHRRDARRSDTSNQVKAARIIECAAGMSEVIFAANLREPDALRLEKDMIGHLRDHGLTNISSGSVHPIESEMARIDNGIAAIRPFDEWLSVARPDQLELAVELKGSHRAFYEFFVDAYNRLRSETLARLNLIRDRGSMVS